MTLGLVEVRDVDLVGIKGDFHGGCLYSRGFQTYQLST